MLAKLEDFVPFKSGLWTDRKPLPGGDFQVDAFDGEVAALERDYPFLDTAFATRLVRLYGTDARRILGEAASLDDLGKAFGSNLHEAEVKWLMNREWARTAEDVLWRRTKLGLRLGKQEADALDAYMSGHLADQTGAAA